MGEEGLGVSGQVQRLREVWPCLGGCAPEQGLTEGAGAWDPGPTSGWWESELCAPRPSLVPDWGWQAETPPAQHCPEVALVWEGQVQGGVPPQYPGKDSAVFLLL